MVTNGPRVCQWPQCFCVCRLSALVDRCSQACFDEANVRMHIYSDDPIAAIRGNAVKQSRSVAILLFIWILMGFSLVAHKGQWNKKVVWIGCQLHIEENAITAAIKKSFIDELREETNKISTNSYITAKDLRKYTGQWPTWLGCRLAGARSWNAYGPH